MKPSRSVSSLLTSEGRLYLSLKQSRSFRSPITLHKLFQPYRYKSTAPVSSISKPPKSKYPPIKPDPYRYTDDPLIADPRPTLARYRHGQRVGPPVDVAEINRKLYIKLAASLVLFVGGLTLAQFILPPDTRLQNDAITEEDRKKFEEAVKVGNTSGVIIREATIGGDRVDTVPSGTSSVGPLPKQIYLPAGVSRVDNVLEEYTLIGHGIRTVSFLGIQVYVVALYIATSSLPHLQQHLLKSLDIPSSATTATLPEREALKKKLLSDEGSIEFFSELLDSVGPASGVKMALRVVPTRSTDYPHLRDGWIRGIQGKTQLHPELYDDDVFSDSLTRFKAIFGGRKGVPKGRVLLLVRDENGALFGFGPDTEAKTKEVKSLAEGARKEEAMDGLKMLGVMDDPRISRALWLCYFAGKKVASEPARQSVVDGLVGVVSRPVGSTEGRVV